MSSKSVLEGILKYRKPEVRIVKKNVTKQGKVNWIVDVDRASKLVLLDRKRLCLEFERYRIVEYVNIVRCFRCQAFGHYANDCSGVLHCPKCSGEHELKQCKSDSVRCCNCYFENSDGDCGHRADSSSCPVFIAYRGTKLSNRS